MSAPDVLHATWCRVAREPGIGPDLDCPTCLRSLGIRPDQVMRAEAILVRREVLNDSDVTGCTNCGAPLPETFVDDAAWFCDIVQLPGRLEAVVKCPNCW